MSTDLCPYNEAQKSIAAICVYIDKTPPKKSKVNPVESIVHCLWTPKNLDHKVQHVNLCLSHSLLWQKLKTQLTFHAIVQPSECEHFHWWNLKDFSWLNITEECIY